MRQEKREKEGEGNKSLIKNIFRNQKNYHPLYPSGTTGYAN
jgi:hypothetical protein